MEVGEMNASKTQQSISEAAKEAASWFELAVRDESNPEESRYTRTKDGRPEWVQDIVYKAHGDFGPDDWRYERIWNALEWLAEGRDPDDSGEYADEQVDCYTGRRLAWLASNLNRPGYCDQAIEEFGVERGENSDIVSLVGMGQYMEASEVYNLVVEALNDHVES